MSAALVLVLASTALASGWTKPHEVIYGNNAYAVTFDSSGHAHYALANEQICCNYGVEYADANMDVCVAPCSTNPFYPDLAIAWHSGKARIAWDDSDTSDALWLSRDDTGSWVSSRLFIGKAYAPHVVNFGRGIAVIFADGHNRVRFLTWDPVTGPTVAQTLSTEAAAGYSTATRGHQLAVGYVSATSTAATKVVVALLADGQWHATVVCTGVCSEPSVAISSAGVPVVVDVQADGAYYRYRTGANSWSRALRVSANSTP